MQEQRLAIARGSFPKQREDTEGLDGRRQPPCLPGRLGPDMALGGQAKNSLLESVVSVLEVVHEELLEPLEQGYW